MQGLIKCDILTGSGHQKSVYIFTTLQTALGDKYHLQNSILILCLANSVLFSIIVKNLYLELNRMNAEMREVLFLPDGNALSYSSRTF